MTRSHPRRSPRVATRLLAIVLLPVLGMMVFAGLHNWRLQATNREAQAIERAVDRVERQVRADLVVGEYLFLRGAVTVGADFGLDVEATGLALGIDLQAELDGAIAAYERFLREVGVTTPLGERVLEIVGGLDDLESAQPIEELASLVGSTTMAATALDETDRLLLRAGHVGRIRTISTAVRSSLDAMTALGRQLSWSALILSTDAGDPRRAMLQQYRAYTADYDDAVRELELIRTMPSEAHWVQLDERPVAADNAEWFAGLARASIDELDEAGNPILLAKALGQGVQRMSGYSELAMAGLQEAMAEAARLRADVGRSLLIGNSVTALVAAVSLALVFLIARSINRPIRALATAAERVSTGELDDLRMPRGGPPELRRVTSTLAEVVANLRTVEAQVGTLAAGDLDDDILDAPVPGRLGTLLHDSVARLSQSMTDREELGHRLEHEATHDPLTQLPNRLAARVTLAAALERARRAGTAVAVLFLDLDGFKQVNDTHGHDIGDRVLAATAERLQGTLRGGDMVARIGGDEFVVIAEQAGDAYAMLELGQRLIDEVSTPITVGSIATRVGASVGVALALDGETDPDLLLRDADLAAYRAKSGGRGRVELFDEHLRAEVSRRIDVELALRSGIEAGELELYFQPVVNPAGITQSLEALVRWNRPGHGLVPPGDFIAVAEGSDLIIDLGRWVLRNACEHLVLWGDDPDLRDLSVGVNLSGRHLLSLTVLDDVRAAFELTGADPNRMVIEITETVLMADLPLVVDHLEQLRSMGIKIAIDDFGTGYTSLTHLRRLPVDVIKVDRSMVVSAERPADALVLKLLVDTVHSLGLRLIAEGVETLEQLERVETLGCDQIQGYLFSRPVPALGLREAMRLSSISQN